MNTEAELIIETTLRAFVFAQGLDLKTYCLTAQYNN